METRVSTTPIGCLIILICYTIIIALLSIWTQNSMDFWLEYAESAKRCPFWAAMVITFFGSAVVVPANIITFICTFFL